MYSLTELKKGTLVQLSGVPYQIIDSQHSKLGRGGAVVRTKLRNLKDGRILSQTFKGNDKVEPARIERKDMQYLYQEGSDLMLMDTDTYDQTKLATSSVGSSAKYLAPGSDVVALIFNGQVVGIELPKKITAVISHTEPGVRGDTSGTALKPAQLESGATVQVPLFIKTGDIVIVDTSNGSYLERAK
jgi:elongation factor P